MNQLIYCKLTKKVQRRSLKRLIAIYGRTEMLILFVRIYDTFLTNRNREIIDPRVIMKKNTYLRHCAGQCINPVCICMYLRLRGDEGVDRGGNPYVTSSPTRARARFVSLADFCRLTPKHPWTLPPPFTFNLYQSIQPSRRIERTNMHETGRTRCGRHRVLFTADSAFILLSPFAA